MRPSRRIGQILDKPEQEDNGDDPELAGDDHQHQATVPALIEHLDLIGCQIPFFHRK